MQAPAGDLPPAHPWQERRKFIAEADGGRWLVKFAGLGRVGAGKLERARAWRRAGFGPSRRGFATGFSSSAGATTSSRCAASRRLRRAARRLLERVGEYLAFRARRVPGGGRERRFAGRACRPWARHNTVEALGAAAAAAWERGSPMLERWRRPCIGSRPTAACTPGNGSSVARDRSRPTASTITPGHDLVGCQDIAWDVVAAGFELGLTEAEEARLAASVALRTAETRRRRACAPFLRPCYLAFQLGHWTEAQSACSDGDEARRIGAAWRERYARALRRALGRGAARRRPLAGQGLTVSLFSTDFTPSMP